jgi:NADH-quinone oxidoreductase subunit N
MTFFLLSLASIPPLVGFPGKFYILRAAVASGGLLLAIAILVGTMISLYYYLRPIAYMFQHADVEAPVASKAHWAQQFAVGAMLVGTLVLGLVPSLVTSVLQHAVHALYGL